MKTQEHEQDKNKKKYFWWSEYDKEFLKYIKQIIFTRKYDCFQYHHHHNNNNNYYYYYITIIITTITVHVLQQQQQQQQQQQ